MRPTTKVVLVALAAGTLGALASLATSGPGPLLRTRLGQRVLGQALSASAPPPAGVPVAQRGERIAPFVLRRLDGGQLAFPSGFAGRPVLVNLWASWCGPCVGEMPELQRFAAAQGPHGVQVVGIALDDEANVREFLRKVPVSYPIALDVPDPADAGVRLGNPAGVLPYSILVSGDGTLLEQRIGPFAPGEIDRWTRR